MSLFGMVTEGKDLRKGVLEAAGPRWVARVDLNPEAKAQTSESFLCGLREAQAAYTERACQVEHSGSLHPT